MKKCIWTVLPAAVLLAGCSSTSDAAVPEAAPVNAPFPEADANAVTFDNVGEEIAELISDDDSAAAGTLSVESVDGNRMLKFTDNSTTADHLDEAVQKIRINVIHLLAPEQLEQVRSIEFDVYAQAKADAFVSDEGEHLYVPGWIGGGGGTETADGKWYGFADFSASDINEYTLERSDACHITFKFLLASSGRKWDADMTEPYFQIMRWGMQNVSDLYIDNITFYDENGASIPLTLKNASGAEAG